MSFKKVEMTPVPPEKSADFQQMFFYLVRSRDGKWFRRKGYGGGGDSWVDDVRKARTYINIAGARGVASWWASNYPQYGAPTIIVYKASVVGIFDEAKRIKEAEEARQRKEEKRELREREEELEDAKRNLDEAQRKYRKLKGQSQ